MPYYPPSYDPGLFGLVRWLQWLHAGASVLLIPLRHGSHWSYMIVICRDGKQTAYNYENNRMIPLVPRANAAYE